MTVAETCSLAKENAGAVASSDSATKNNMLAVAALAVLDNAETILESNARDMSRCDRPPQFIDRLMLNGSRLKEMSLGLEKLIQLDDPVGEVTESWTMPNGLRITKVRTPLGVIGIIYEARPNVTVDAIGLCIKTGNAIVLRGSKEAYNSNKALVDTVKTSLRNAGYNPEFIQLIEDTSREGAETLMKCHDSVNVLIPRGSAALIRAVVEKSTVPVIETGAGNCHAYVEKSADIEKALKIVLNGKLRRPGVCNALESLIIDEAVHKEYLPVLLGALYEKGVEIAGCDKTLSVFKHAMPATEEDYYSEFLSLKISVKVVKDIYEACNHINKYSTKHSETIITEDGGAAEYFASHIDSAAVYVNASTCFTDGFQFGFGAEMGISTQKLHARGPLGLKQLTSEKYVIYGNGQTRE